MTNNDILTSIKPILEGLLIAPIINDDVSDKIIDFDAWTQPVLKKFNAGIKALNLKHNGKFGFNKQGGFLEGSGKKEDYDLYVKDYNTFMAKKLPEFTIKFNKEELRDCRVTAGTKVMMIRLGIL